MAGRFVGRRPSNFELTLHRFARCIGVVVSVAKDYAEIWVGDLWPKDTAWPTGRKRASVRVDIEPNSLHLYAVAEQGNVHIFEEASFGQNLDIVCVVTRFFGGQPWVLSAIMTRSAVTFRMTSSMSATV
jgi:hypothetical protein